MQLSWFLTLHVSIHQCHSKKPQALIQWVTWSLLACSFLMCFKWVIYWSCCHLQCMLPWWSVWFLQCWIRSFWDWLLSVLKVLFTFRLPWVSWSTAPICLVFRDDWASWVQSLSRIYHFLWALGQYHNHYLQCQWVQFFPLVLIIFQWLALPLLYGLRIFPFMRIRDEDPQ